MRGTRSGTRCRSRGRVARTWTRSEEHTSEPQSHHDLVCRLLLEKKKNTQNRDLVRRILSLNKYHDEAANHGRSEILHAPNALSNEAVTRRLDHRPTVPDPTYDIT